MKKTILMLLLLMGNYFYSNAQTIRINNGVSVSNFIGTTEYADKSVVFYTGGVGIDYLDRDYYFLNTEVNYIRKGESYYQNISSVIQGVSGVSRVFECLNYASVNTSINGKLPLGKVVPFIGFGLRGDFLINNSIKRKKKTYEGYSLYGKPRGGMFGAILNAGILFSFKDWDFGFRYTGYVDFLNAYKDSKTLSYTQTINLSVGIKLKK